MSLEARLAQVEARLAVLEASRQPVDLAPGEVDTQLIARLQGRSGPRFGTEDERGAVLIAGHIRLGERSAAWHVERGLPELDEVSPGSTAAVLAAVGHPVRVRVVLALLRSGPCRAAELQELLGLGSPGQLYHHLEKLVAAGVVVHQEPSRFTVPARNVVPVLALVAAGLDLSAGAAM